MERFLAYLAEPFWWFLYWLLDFFGIKDEDRMKKDNLYD